MLVLIQVEMGIDLKFSLRGFGKKFQLARSLSHNILQDQEWRYHSTALIAGRQPAHHVII